MEEFDIRVIIEEFEAACVTYKLALTSRTSNRSVKELTRQNTRGTTIHKFQCEFAWILHDIQCGPKCQVYDNIEKSKELINHIFEVSKN
jgi:hypothetical protein